MASRRDRVVITRVRRDQLKQVARRTVGSASIIGFGIGFKLPAAAAAADAGGTGAQQSRFEPVPVSRDWREVVLVDPGQ
jgi:hypothetical protein